MKRIALLISCCLFAGLLFAQNTRVGPSIDHAETKAGNTPANPEIKSRHVDIWSDGTRLSGDLWYPEDLSPEDKLPVIIMCHGWGGVRLHLNEYYVMPFAMAGYAVLTFDYRGWGDSDSKLVIKETMPKPGENGEVTVKAQAIRELVDPFDQTEDIISCIDFISGEPGIDITRIGLWGTSFAGGHVIYVAAIDTRVKCIVSQAPSMTGSWVDQYFNSAELASQRARGDIDPVPQGDNKMEGLEGTPYLARIAKFHPVNFADRLEIPVLIIVAEKEELMDNSMNGELVYNIIKDKVPSRYEVFKGTHFEIYDTGREETINFAIEWFDSHL